MAVTKSKTKKSTSAVAESQLIDLENEDLSIVLADDADIICAFRFGKGKDIGIVSVNEFNGARALDLRRFYYNDDAEMYQPTPKGIRIPLTAAPEVVTALHEARDRLA